MPKSFETRFWRYVNKNGPLLRPDLGNCWVWTGGIGKNGKPHRGHIRIGRSDEGQIGASRASWIVHFGKIPDKKFVLHHCDNGICVRPDHLYLGTQRDNMADKSNRGRHHLLGRGYLVAGDKNANSKLDWDAVSSIRQRCKKMGVAPSSVAKEYGITVGAVYHILCNRTWRV